MRQAKLWFLPYLTAVLALLASWIPFYLTATQLAHGANIEYALGSIALKMDGLGLLISAVALGLGTAVALYSGPYLSKETGQEKFYAMLLLMISMIIGLGCATDLFNLWIWFEAMAVTSYLLVAFYRDQPAALEAGFKYLVQNRPGRCWLSLGLRSYSQRQVRLIWDISAASRGHLLGWPLPELYS